MTGSGNRGGTNSLLGDALHAGDFQESVEEQAQQFFETGTTVEGAVAFLWDDDDEVWDMMREETPTPEWHGTATDIKPLVRTHVLRLVKGWKHESAVVEFLDRRADLVRPLGYKDTDDVLQSKLWRAWNKRYSDTLQEAIEVTADILVEEARDHNVPAPEEIFRPSEETTDDPSDRTERELVSKHTKEVWQQAKPFIEDSFYLKRGENSQIDEGAWWEQHTFLGMRSDMYAESGADSFRDDTTRDEVPVGRHHRDKLQMLGVDEIRGMVQRTTRALIERARHNNELVGNLTVAIDITKGHPWTGEIEREEDGQNLEDYILGYKNAESHFQWASIQVVGHDIPLVLDVMPVQRGVTRDQIVDTLLGSAVKMVGGIELVMMDREFDTDSVKAVCEQHDVYYLNPARKKTSERAMCTRLREAGKVVHIKEQQVLSGSSRKRMYLPSTATDIEPAVEDPDLADDPFADEEDEDEEDEESVRQEMMDEFSDVIGELEDETDTDTYEKVVDEVREEEEEERTVGAYEDKRAYALFETNHPYVSVKSDDGEPLGERDQIQMVERMVQRYSHRWGIENGFKKIKTFMVRTASKNHRYRFFNFAFACVLYNVWRLVDLLVKLAIDGENAEYAPKVDANRFLTHAKKHYGLDPPD